MPVPEILRYIDIDILDQGLVSVRQSASTYRCQDNALREGRHCALIAGSYRFRQKSHQGGLAALEFHFWRWETNRDLNDPN